MALVENDFLHERPPATLPQRLMGNFIVFFSALIILAGAAGFLISIFCYVAVLNDRDEFHHAFMLLLVIVVGSSFLQVLGHIMGMFGEYLMGRMRHSTRDEIVARATFGVITDLAMVLAVLTAVFFLISLAVNLLLALSMLVICVLLVFASLSSRQRLVLKK